MPVNSDKPHLWKADTLESIDFYNDWFLRLAPLTYRQQREIRTKEVANALEITDNLRSLTIALLKTNPGILPMLRMTAAPPLARDRLIGLAYTSKNLITSMEGSEDKAPRIPPRIAEAELDAHLTRIVDVLSEVADRDLFPWLECPALVPTQEEKLRSASVIADRLCGAAADPIIRNAQERRQLSAIGNFLQAYGYREIAPGDFDDLLAMPTGTYTFRCNVTVGSRSSPVNIPIDCVIAKHGRQPDELPLLVEAKSAGDATNTNKRRKEEAQKFTQLKDKFGKHVTFVLFLCGYFEPSYLGYEASEGIDWIWEHRIKDFLYYLEEISRESSTTHRAKEDTALYSSDFLPIEAERLRRQKEVDSSKTALQRNQQGQFSTPFSLARQITAYTLSLYRDARKLSMCEPACGSGVFISACISLGKTDFFFRGIEIDNAYANICRDLFADYDVEVIHDDFFNIINSERAQNQCDLIITNPPYIRHHHIDPPQKRILQNLVRSRLHIEVSGLSGLYIYYLLLSHALLKQGGISSWLIPSEFLYTNYGKALRIYLAEQVTLLRIHRFDADDVQFDDALVSSCVVTFQKSEKPKGYLFDFTKGAYETPKSIEKISSNRLNPLVKWSFIDPEISELNHEIVLEDLFHITRGLATGNNDFFILDNTKVTEKGIESTFLVPLLPSPRELKSPIIEADADGLPIIPRNRFLLSVTKSLEELNIPCPGVLNYLEEGVKKGVPDGYLCRSRRLWYLQEKRDPPLYLATYMGRQGSTHRSPIRFFLNRSHGLVTNVFICLYPRLDLQRLLQGDPARQEELLDALNSISPATLEKAGRHYGGGLQKVEPKELRSVRLERIPSWLAIKKMEQGQLFQAQQGLGI